MDGAEYTKEKRTRKMNDWTDGLITGSRLAVYNAPVNYSDTSRHHCRGQKSQDLRSGRPSQAAQLGQAGAGTPRRRQCNRVSILSRAGSTCVWEVFTRGDLDDPWESPSLGLLLSLGFPGVDHTDGYVFEKNLRSTDRRTSRVRIEFHPTHVFGYWPRTRNRWKPFFYSLFPFKVLFTDKKLTLTVIIC